MTEVYKITIEGNGLKIVQGISSEMARRIVNTIMREYPEDHPLHESKHEEGK
ncbi:MAG TPA: hypothetical protein VFE62_26205 [Gemmataceae bacterium]|nr:hypothetical protein [Gemmataceae bacterium]